VPGIYSVRTVNASGCVSNNEASVTITMLSKPTVNFDYNSYCINVPVAFNNLTNSTASAGVTYKWSDNRGNISTLMSPTLVYATEGQVRMTLVATSTYCPNVKDSITKNISIEAPRAAVRLPLVDAVIGDDTRLQARVFAGTQYLWSPADLLSNPTSTAPLVKISAEQEFKILMTTLSGCQTTDTILVRAFEDYSVFVPSVFSPNGDGQNDKIYVNFVGIKEFKFFRIYNRAGQKVFETTNPGEGWDGNVNGVAQPIDSYMWVVEAISKYGAPVNVTGLITLLR
jgi:gliding motility-associated-like protein